MNGNINFIVGILLFLFACAIAQNLDIEVLKEIYLNRNQSLDETFRVITNLAYPIVFSVPVFLLVKGLAKKEVAAIQNILYVIISIFLAAVIAAAFKYGIDRPRPFVTYDYLQNVKESISPSFPSGHTTLTFALVASLAKIYGKRFLTLLLYIWSTLVAYSRLHLGLHYPSDVLFGMIIGITSAFLCHKMRLYIVKK
ncbi:phosphatase PAP2 family protein [Aequorivita sp. CIP111184]|uniref:phosphatase PAP2 family protein n=1 Tax=Aequorivita sp. CIP111184 TaxID=2211356 RepID=UPI000DBC2797|nr:phosphatase PAP2 family protein [Aequorivita sp. CIP111184]SRX53860.1 Undecaprenyl-diphosphatase BcrC [Aequorivita sp. CIP111184]